MRIGQIVNALPALQKLGNENLTLKTLYWVNKLLSALDKELSFYNAQQRKILNELGTEVQPGKWEIPPEIREQYLARMTELANIEIEGDFKVVKLPMTENISLSYNDMKMLEGLVELDFVEKSE